MSDVVSIEELEAELNLNATSFAAYSVEIGLHWITTRVRVTAPHRVCSFCMHSANAWDMMYEDVRIRFQLTSGNRSVCMWNVHDNGALLFSSVDPLGVCVCFKRLVGLIRDRRAGVLTCGSGS